MIESIKDTLVLKAGEAELFLGKHSPDIFLGLGVIGVISGAVLACAATLKAKEVWEEAAETIEEIKNARRPADVEEWAKEEKYELNELETKAIFVVAANSAVELAKLYAPSVILTAFAVAALVQSRNILTARNAGILAALKLSEEAYNKYRERITSELGEEFDIHIRSGGGGEDHDPYLVATKDEKGKLKEVQMDPTERARLKLGVSQYARFFDDSSPQWRQSPEMNQFFLSAQQTSLNVDLQTRGHVFLNEVWDALGLPRTKAGAVVGWVRGNGDDVIDLGIYKAYNADFINGYPGDNEVLIDPNVDGVIYDLI